MVSKLRFGMLSALAMSLAAAYGAPAVSVKGFNGKFTWYKASTLPASALKSLGNATTLTFEVTFPADVTLTAAKGGNSWFSFLIADQGSDWKWNQTKASAIVPVSGNKIKAGKYTLKAKLDGIPSKVLKDKQQLIQFGAGASGLAKPISFTIDNIKGS